MSSSRSERTPLDRARIQAGAELKGQALPKNEKWLHENKLLWLRALNRMKFDTENHMAKDKASVDKLGPYPGEQPSQEYLRERKAYRARSVARWHFHEMVVRRIEEVKVLLGAEPAVGFVMAGDMVELMVDFVRLADEGDLESIKSKALYQAERWAKQLEQDRAEEQPR